jgi:DNA-binding winged helix-turn-helix (wHTH) protein
MDASAIHAVPAALGSLGRFTRVSVQTPAGEIEARLSDMGNWELRVRREEDPTWRLACRGDLECGAVSSEPVVIPREEKITCGPLTVEPWAHRVAVAGAEIYLSRKEFALLLALASQPNRVFTKAELLDTVWDYSGGSDLKTRTLDSHASRLRRKLRAAGAESMIVNSHGVGYRLWDRPDLRVPPLLRPTVGAA